MKVYTPILTLLAVLVFAGVIKQVLKRYAQRWYVVTTGLEYLLLGLVLGPAFTGVVDELTLQALEPAMSIGIGSIGLLAGLRLNPRRMTDNLESAHAWVSFWIAGVTVLLMGGGSLAGLIWYTQAESLTAVWPLVPLTLLITATAVVSATTPVQYTVGYYKARGWTSRCVVYVAEFSEVFGILIFGMAFAIYHPPQDILGYRLDAVHWYVIQIVLGGLFGGLFSLFIGNQEKSDKMLVAVLGIIIFSAGIASYSLVSPLLITFMVGLVLAATSHFGDQLREQLEQIEKPFYMVICFLAGLAWVPAWGGGWELVVLALYFGGRWVSKWLGGRLATLAEDKRQVDQGMGLGLLAQGGLSVAMVLSYLQVHRDTHTLGSKIYQLTYQERFQVQIEPVRAVLEEHNLTALVTTGILISILIYETLAVRATRNLLINAGDINPDVHLEGEIEPYDIDSDEDDLPQEEV